MRLLSRVPRGVSEKQLPDKKMVKKYALSGLCDRRARFLVRSADFSEREHPAESVEYRVEEIGERVINFQSEYFCRCCSVLQHERIAYIGNGEEHSRCPAIFP